MGNANGNAEVLVKHSRDAKQGQEKWGKHLPARQNRRQYPAGEVYARSDYALRTNARSIAKEMPSLGEFSGYIDWEVGRGRWPKGGENAI